MEKIKRFDKSTCNRVAAQAVEDLVELAKELGCEVERGKGKYTSNTFELTIKFAVVGADGEAVTLEREHLRLVAPEFDGLEVMVNGYIPGVVVGLRRKAHKFPYIVRTNDGKQYVVPYELVKASHERKQVAKG